MTSRHADWLKQAEADLKHARHSREAEDFEWSCFAAQQAAEKAVKALYEIRHLDAWGHTVSTLLGSLPVGDRPEKKLIDRAKVLDKHYIPARYPNGFESGAPTDFYTDPEANEAISIAEEILAYCRYKMQS